MNLLVVSSYPEKSLTHGKKTVGVASYTKNTLLSMKKADSNLKITVLAEILEKPGEYIDDSDIRVKRVWKRDSFASVFKLLLGVIKQPEKKILLPFEMYMWKNNFLVLVFISTLYLYRIFGKNITLVLHQIVDDVSAFEKNPIKAIFYKTFRKLFYTLLTAPCGKVVVFEGKLKRRLGNKKKVSVIPHAVEKLEIVDKKSARKKLKLSENKKYALYFGFLSPYKGVDKLLEIWKKKSETKLIIAGGINPNYENDPQFIKFNKNIQKKAKEVDALITGFLPEDQIKYYFSTCDLVVLPYTTFMSSSGPLAFAFSFNRPVLMSNPLKAYLESDDIKKALNKAEIDNESLFFDFDEDDLSEKIENILKNYKKYFDFSSEMAKIRNWSKIGKDYVELLNKT